MKQFPCAPLCALFLAAACVTPGDRGSEKMNEQLRSENALARGRITLLQRENSVLKDENIQRKKDAGELRAKIERLEADLEALKDRHSRDVAQRDARYKSLEEQNEVLKRESSGKIQELTRLNADTQQRLEAEVKHLGEEIAKGREDWNIERERLKNEGARKEFALMKEIDTLKKESSGKDEEMASQRALIEEHRKRLDNAGKEIESGRDALARLEKIAVELRDKLQGLEPSRGDGRKPEK